MRALERQIGALCRAVAVRVAETNPKTLHSSETMDTNVENVLNEHESVLKVSLNDF